MTRTKIPPFCIRHLWIYCVFVWIHVVSTSVQLFLLQEYRKKCYTPCENVDLKTALGTWNQKHPDVTQRRLKEMQETIDVLDSRMRTLDAKQRKTNKTLKGIRYNNIPQRQMLKTYVCTRHMDVILILNEHILHNIYTILLCFRGQLTQIVEHIQGPRPTW